MIPTGWTVDNINSPGAVFKSIKRAPRTKTDWRQIFADHCGISDPSTVRLWWFYSRKSDEKKHDFRKLGWEALGDDEATQRVCTVSKVIPTAADGGIALGHEKTSGEKLADQLFQAAANPNFKPNVD